MCERYVVINGSINGKELFVSTKKNPEGKLQTETHAVIGKAAGDFQNQQKNQENDREHFNEDTKETMQEKIKRMPVTEASQWQCTKSWWM